MTRTIQTSKRLWLLAGVIAVLMESGVQGANGGFRPNAAVLSADKSWFISGPRVAMAEIGMPGFPEPVGIFDAAPHIDVLGRHLWLWTTGTASHGPLSGDGQNGIALQFRAGHGFRDPVSALKGAYLYSPLEIARWQMPSVLKDHMTDQFTESIGFDSLGVHAHIGALKNLGVTGLATPNARQDNRKQRDESSSEGGNGWVIGDNVLCRASSECWNLYLDEIGRTFFGGLALIAFFGVIYALLKRLRF